MNVITIDRYYETDTGSQWRWFTGAFGWLDPSGEGYQTKHCLLIGGQMVDGRYIIIEEATGTLVDILNAAVDAKDRFYIRHIWGDTTDRAITIQVYDHEGLTTYKPIKTDEKTGLVTYAEPLPLNRWPHFRDHSCLCAFCSVPLMERASIAAGLARVDRWNAAGKLGVVPGCQTVANVLGEREISRLFNDPVAKALSYLVWALEVHDEDLRIARDTQTGDDHYGGRI